MEGDDSMEGDDYSSYYRNLEDNKVKLVVYTIISLQPGAERILPYNSTGSVLVTKRMTPAEFTAWVIALYLESDRNKAAIPHEEKQYLRVSYSVTQRWEKIPFDAEKEEVIALRNISDALLAEPCWDPEHGD